MVNYKGHQPSFQQWMQESKKRPKNLTKNAQSDLKQVIKLAPKNCIYIIQPRDSKKIPIAWAKFTPNVKNKIFKKYSINNLFIYFQVFSPKVMLPSWRTLLCKSRAASTNSRLSSIYRKRKTSAASGNPSTAMMADNANGGSQVMVTVSDITANNITLRKVASGGLEEEHDPMTCHSRASRYTTTLHCNFVVRHFCS